MKDSIRKRVIEEINKLRTKFDEKQFSSMLSSSITAAIKEVCSLLTDLIISIMFESHFQRLVLITKLT